MPTVRHPHPRGSTHALPALLGFLAGEAEASDARARMESATQEQRIEPATTSRTGIERRDLWIVVAIAALSRLIYLAQYAEELPFLYGPIADSIVYLEQAFRVRHGELGAAVLLAFSPLYGYFLALFAPNALLAPVLAQLLFGCLTAVILYVTAQRSAGTRAARFTAGLYLGYGTLLYYESKLLSESLSLLLGALALYVFLGDGVRNGRIRDAAIAGALFALAVLARASLVFAAPITVLAAALPWQQPREPLTIVARRAAGITLGFALVLGGNGLLNHQASGLFVPVILVSRTVEASSAHAYDGQLSSIRVGEGLASSYDVVESAKQRLADVQRGVEQAPSSAARIDLIAWARNAPGKLLQTMSPREITFQYGFNGERGHVPILRAFPISFGVLLLWGLIGAVARFVERGWRALVPFSPLILGVIVTTTLYHPSTRYRLAMVLPLLLLAGIGLDWLLRFERKRRAVWLGAAIVVSVGLACLHLTSRGYNRAEFALQLSMSAGMSGDLDAQVTHATEAIRLAPTDPSIRQRATVLIQHAQQPPPR